MAPTFIQRITGRYHPDEGGLYNSPHTYPGEKDVEQAVTSTFTPSPHNRSSTFQPSSKLRKFQNLVGIQSTHTVLPGRPAPNPGIYKRTAEEESKIHFQYVLSTYVVNIFFLLQIVVGAALTALGAANGPSAAVTFLGALNTVVAGILTYLKGQGLPMRLEQYQHLLRTLREHIEEREREFAEPDCSLDVDEVVQSIVQMYKEVRQTAEDNAPGNVLPPKGAIASLMKKTESGNRVPTAETPGVGEGGSSVADKLKNAEIAIGKAGPAMRHGMEDMKAVKERAERVFTSEQEKLKGIVAEAATTKDEVLGESGDKKRHSVDSKQY